MRRKTNMLRAGLLVAGGLFIATVLAAQWNGHKPKPFLKTYYYYDSSGTCPSICDPGTSPQCECLCPTCGPR
jgi:hypothetical protein